jgi:hypothetical protein
METALHKYECSFDGEHWDTYIASSRGKAKGEYFRDLDGDFPYTKIKCRLGQKNVQLETEPVFEPKFSKGDTVVMHTCHESTLPQYKGKVWTCITDSYLDAAKQEVVFLEGFSGWFSAGYLTIVKATNIAA